MIVFENRVLQKFIFIACFCLHQLQVNYRFFAVEVKRKRYSEKPGGLI